MEADGQVDLSILIVNWNVKNYLQSCLNSIYEKTRGISFEIIIVDNASTDGSIVMLRNEFADVRIIECPENLGFGRANNKALPFTKGKYIGLLNPDTIIENDALSLLVKELESDATIAIVGPKLLAGNGAIQRVCARKFNNFWDWCKLLLFTRENSTSYRNYLDISEYEIDQSVECISGACMVIRREIIDQYIFDPRFFMYGEDVDLCFTTINHGWKIYYLSKALVIHYGGESSKQANEFDQYTISALYALVEKRYGKIASFIFRSIGFSLSAAKLLVTEFVLMVPFFRHNQVWDNRRSIYKQGIRLALKVD